MHVCKLDFSTHVQFKALCKGNGVDYSGLGLSTSIHKFKIIPTGMTANPNVNIPSVRLSSKLTPGYVMLTIKANNHTAHYWYFMLCNMAFSRISYHWINTIRSPFRLALAFPIWQPIYIHPLSAYHIGYWSIHWLEVISVTSKAQQLRVEFCKCVCMECAVNISFPSSW